MYSQAQHCLYIQYQFCIHRPNIVYTYSNSFVFTGPALSIHTVSVLYSQTQHCLYIHTVSVLYSQTQHCLYIHTVSVLYSQAQHCLYIQYQFCIHRPSIVYTYSISFVFTDPTLSIHTYSIRFVFTGPTLSIHTYSISFVFTGPALSIHTVSVLYSQAQHCLYIQYQFCIHRPNIVYTYIQYQFCIHRPNIVYNTYCISFVVTGPALSIHIVSVLYSQTQHSIYTHTYWISIRELSIHRSTIVYTNWAASRENLSSGFPKSDIHSNSFTILDLWVLRLPVSHINESHLQTYESRTLFLMTSLKKYYCILGLAEIKTLHPKDKIMRKDAGCTGNKITVFKQAC